MGHLMPKPNNLGTPKLFFNKPRETNYSNKNNKKANKKTRIIKFRKQNLEKNQLQVLCHGLINMHRYYISSSSFRAGSTDIPDPLSPLLSIVHRPR